MSEFRMTDSSAGLTIADHTTDSADAGAALAASMAAGVLAQASAAAAAGAGDAAAGAAHQALLDEALAFIEAHEGAGAQQAPPGTMAAMQLQAMQAAAALGLM